MIGKPAGRVDNKKARLQRMIRLALGQSKMGVKPLAGSLHLIVYLGFILINIELIEIVLDGLLGTHRLFAPFLGRFYDFLIGSFELLALLVLGAVLFFWGRRNLLKIKRFWKPEMKGWPKKDADYILYFEVVLMLLFLCMNATDALLQQREIPHYIQAGSFPISHYLTPFFAQLPTSSLLLLERIFWWAHIGGILLFLNYLYYSKHLHILLAFPNTFYSNLAPLGKFNVDSTI
ncbi:MAG: Fe-S oxidoreductase, partial [Flavobacteriia bacterium]|nr:Fe-S oxidoreductase [Flavobacteriia bacterium]